jgi:hypothetical protein
MVKLSGILEYSMGGFLCLRGFASYKMLSNISQPNPEVQRDLIEAHKGEMAAFLNHGEYRFFPEVILSLNITDGKSDFSLIESMYSELQKGETWNRWINGFQFIVSQNKTKSVINQFYPMPKVDKVNIAHIKFDEKIHVLTRIDGNHRLSASSEVIEDFETPFCLLLFRTPHENDQYSRAIFHNINAKQIPLLLEDNLKVILRSTEVFSDLKLKEDPSFGWPYYLARKIINSIDYSFFPTIYAFIEKSQHSFFVDLFEFLIHNGSVEKNESAVDKVKSELANIERALVESDISGTTDNVAVIGALAYYKITNTSKYRGFLSWTKRNNIGKVKNLHITDVINLYDEIFEHVPQKAFLARWYPTADNCGEQDIRKANQRIESMKEVAEDLNLELIDLGTRDTGTFDIRAVMYREICECDIFIADLTGARHNVMIEVGYALKHVGTGRMLFYFQESEVCKSVPFDVSHLNYVPIVDSGEIRSSVKERIITILTQAKNGEI